MRSRLPEHCKAIAVGIERSLALVIMVGVVAFGVVSARVLLAMDWGETDTFYEMIYRVLLLVIAVELARTLVTHELRALMEMLGFVIARKMLKPDLGVVDILVSVLAFVILLAANRFWIGGAPVAKDGEPAP